MKNEVTNVLHLANLVRENVRGKQLFTPYNSILVTLSGGQDSICSLLLLYLLQNQLGLEFEIANRAVYKPSICKGRRLTGTKFRSILLRKSVSNQNCVSVNFASQKCGQFGLLWCNHFWQKESFQTMLHVAKINFCFSSTMCFYLAIESVLCEQNAREWRHKSIQRTCAFFHFECCTQGHTKNDRVETILFNILRGTGITGLQSLQWKKNFYSFACQRFYPRLTYYKFNWPQPTANKPSVCKACTNPRFVNGAALLELPSVSSRRETWPRRGLEREQIFGLLSVGPSSVELDKVGVFSKFCLINVRTEPTFRLATRCSYRPRRRLGLSTAPATSFT